MCSIRERTTSRLGWRVSVLFVIKLNEKDLELLKLIQTYWGGIGTITRQSRDCYALTVNSLEQISNKIISHFDQYPLITQKRADYLLFKKIVLKMDRGEHLTSEGLQAIVNLRASMNLGLSEKIQAAFPQTIPVQRGEVIEQSISNYLWLSGFTSGDGCFFVKIGKATTRVGFQVVLVFELTQHVRDEKLMESFIEYLGCGKLAKAKDAVRFKVVKFSDIIEKIIPFFLQHKIRGKKSLDFADWCKVAEIMKAKGDKTLEGLNKIREIKGGMNKTRL